MPEYCGRPEKCDMDDEVVEGEDAEDEGERVEDTSESDGVFLS